MKIASILVASLAAIATLAPVAAQAQHRDDRAHAVRGHGRDHQVRRVCRTEMRHHRRVQVCHTVRR